jgi:predicted kinase/GNAT superfamily N-acetyltransferase
VLVIMGGLPATGKTTISRGLALRLCAAYLRLDTIEAALGAGGPGGYAAAQAVAGDLLRLGQVVVADSVNPVAESREAWRAVATGAGVPFIEVEVVCSDPVEHERRATSRRSDVPGLTVPTWAAITARHYEPWDAQVVVDTAGRDLRTCLDEAAAQIPLWTSIAVCGPEVVVLTEQLRDVYAAAFGAPGYDEASSAAEEFAARTLPLHATRDGFRCAVARTAEDVVGFAYGYTGHRGQWWSDRVATLAPAAVTREWLGGHFEVVELAVAPAAQRQGIGTRLHDRLLHGLPHPRALLTTYRDDRPAPRLYRRLGWRLLVSGLDDDSDLYGRELRSA